MRASLRLTCSHPTQTQDLGSSKADVLSKRECDYSSDNCCEHGKTGESNRCKGFFSQHSLHRTRTMCQEGGSKGDPHESPNFILATSRKPPGSPLPAYHWEPGCAESGSSPEKEKWCQEGTACGKTPGEGAECSSPSWSPGHSVAAPLRAAPAPICSWDVSQ